MLAYTDNMGVRIGNFAAVILSDTGPQRKKKSLPCQQKFTGPTLSSCAAIRITRQVFFLLCCVNFGNDKLQTQRCTDFIATETPRTRPCQTKTKAWLGSSHSNTQGNGARSLELLCAGKRRLQTGFGNALRFNLAFRFEVRDKSVDLHTGARPAGNCVVVRPSRTSPLGAGGEHGDKGERKCRRCRLTTSLFTSLSRIPTASTAGRSKCYIILSKNQA